MRAARQGCKVDKHGTVIICGEGVKKIATTKSSHLAMSVVLSFLYTE